jgi:hypothetical protein
MRELMVLLLSYSVDREKQVSAIRITRDARIFLANAQALITVKKGNV